MEVLKFIEEKTNNLVYEFERKNFLYGSITNEKNGLLNIKAEKIEIKKSIITSREVFFDTSLVDMDRKSKLKCSNKFVVSNKDANCDVEICISDVYSPYVSFNGVESVNVKKGNTSFYQSDLDELQKKRKEVLQVLTNLKLKCEELQKEKTCVELQVIKEIVKK